MKICKIDHRGAITEDSLLDLMGQRGLAKDELGWAKYLTVDFDGTVLIWANEPVPGFTVSDELHHSPLEAQYHDNRWVDPLGGYSLVLFYTCKLFGKDVEPSRIYKLQYEENNNEATEKPSDVDVAGLAAGRILETA